MDAPDRLTFDAERLARAWLSVAVAAAEEGSRPQLYRSTCIDVYPTGVRLTSTDGYMLLTSWVADVEDDEGIAPDLSEVALARYVAVDVYHRARGLLAHLRKLATGKGGGPLDVELIFDVPPDIGRVGVDRLEGMAAACVALEHPDHERVLLDLYEGDWPAWQPLLLGFQPGMTPFVALSPAIVGRLAQLGRWTAGPIRWEWSGEASPARVAIGEGGEEVVGLVMPARADWGTVPGAPDDAAEDGAALTADEARQLAEDDAR